MANNPLPAKRGPLHALGEDMCDGLHEFEVELEIKQTTEAVLRPALTAAINSETAYGECQLLKKAANAVLTAADKAGKTFIVNARKRLSGFFGESYSTEWATAGWPDNSTGLPTTQDDRFALLSSLKAYFTNHAAHASVDLGVTAALADAAHIAISNARATLGLKITECGQAKAARDTADANLRKRMNGLIDELTIVLPPDDPRWHGFGLSRPADEETPEAPTVLIVTPGTPGTLLPDWNDALRADSYRVWLWIVGTDTEFHPVLTVFDSDATLPDLPSGATVKIRITSKNAAGESVPSLTVEAIVP